jgi:glycosyltransferase involved in cell wall biosynthesis
MFATYKLLNIIFPDASKSKKMKEYAVSVIISFYNKIDYLKIILAALERQTFTDFEVIVADDGSTDEVVAEIRRIQGMSAIALQHVWHEDNGFRKTKILNVAISSSRSEYLIFIDGDCIPHHKFVEEHYMNREPSTVLAGRRANISKKLANLLTAENIRSGIMEKGFALKVLIDGLFGKSTHTIKGTYVQSNWLRKFLNRKVTGVLGSNFSIHKKDMLGINGFDERYKAPAVGEDTDIEARLRWNNVKVKMVKNMAVQYHFDHPKLKRSQVNEAIFKDVLRTKQAFTPYGIHKTGAPSDPL